VLHEILDYFPITFRNEDVTVYEVPRMVPPSRKTNFMILNFLEGNSAAFESTISKSGLLLQTVPSFMQLNYTISALPIEANVTCTTVESFRNTSEWTITEGIGEASLDEKDYVAKPGAISVHNITADENGYFAISKEGRWNFTRFDYLQLWIKVSDDIDGEVKFILYDSSGNWVAWLSKSFPKNEWVTLTLPLATPDLESSTKLNFSDVRQIDMGFQQLGPSANYSFFKADEIRGMNSKRFLSYEEVINFLSHSSTIMLTYDPNFDASALLKLVESGSKLVVFNTFDTDTGFFFNLLQLQEEGYVKSNEIALSTTIHLPEAQVPLISTKSLHIPPQFYYKLNGTPVAPFILTKGIGRGEIIYVILPSNILNTLNRTVSSLMTLFKDLADANELKIEECTCSSSCIGSYNTSEGSINITGKIEFDTQHILNIDPIEVQTLEIKTENTFKALTNVTITSLKIYGSTRVIAENTSITVKAYSPSSYLTLFSEENRKQYILELLGNATADISFTNASEISNLHMTEGSLLLDTSRLNIVVRHPSIHIHGETYFESARIHYSNSYVPLAGVVRSNLKINGDTFFVTLFSTKDLMIIGSFSYEGAATANQAPTTQVNQLDIPWLSLLTSPTSFVFHLMLFMFALLSIIQRRRTDLQNV